MIWKSALCGLLVAIAPASRAQVRVTIPAKQFHVGKRFVVSVENNTKAPVTVCIEVGQYSEIEGTVEATPIPFFVQSKSRRGWSTLLIGPDIGSFRHAEILSAGETEKYPFALAGTGTVRLVLHYWPGSRRDSDCAKEPDHARSVKSPPFVIENDRPQ